jgi:3-oxoacyl-[acyl-carrier-protein] synthase-1
MVAELATPVVLECLRSAAAFVGDRAKVIESIPIVLLLSPAWRPHRWPDLDQRVMKDLARNLGRTLPSGSGVIAGGRTGIVAALEFVASLVSKNAAGLCIVIGVESFLRQPIVMHYLKEGRVLCGVNSNGFIPGEAACGVLIGRTGATDGPRLEIRGVGIGMEPSGAGGDRARTVTGDGLTAAIRAALTEAQVEHYDVAFALSDLNGERFKFKESIIARARLDRMPPEGRSRRPAGYLELWHPIENLGEIGAAIFPCLMGWAFEAGRKDYAPSTTAVLHASEDDGTRAALVTAFNRAES